jgi:hypothetical protein
MFKELIKKIISVCAGVFVVALSAMELSDQSSGKEVSSDTSVSSDFTEVKKLLFAENNLPDEQMRAQALWSYLAKEPIEKLWQRYGPAWGSFNSAANLALFNLLPTDPRVVVSAPEGDYRIFLGGGTYTLFLGKGFGREITKVGAFPQDMQADFFGAHVPLVSAQGDVLGWGIDRGIYIFPNGAVSADANPIHGSEHIKTVFCDLALLCNSRCALYEGNALFIGEIKALHEHGVKKFVKMADVGVGDKSINTTYTKVMYAFGGGALLLFQHHGEKISQKTKLSIYNVAAHDPELFAQLELPADKTLLAIKTAFNAESFVLSYADLSSELVSLDLENRSFIRSPLGKNSIYFLYSPDGKQLLCRTVNDQIILVDVKTKKPFGTIPFEELKSSRLFWDTTGIYYVGSSYSDYGVVCRDAIADLSERFQFRKGTKRSLVSRSDTQQS